ncbi:MAG: amidohydrolase family protein [Acidimicrobiia bacterium]
MSGRTLIRGGCVLTLGARTPNFDKADVLISDGRVAEVGRGLRARDAEVVDATDTIVMPGFVDTHRHVWKSLFRNLGESPGVDPAAEPAPEGGPKYQADDVYAATLIGLLGAAEAGITTVVDWADIAPVPSLIDAALQAHADSSLRTVFVYSVPRWAGRPEDEKAGLRRLVARFADRGESLCTIAFGPGEPARSDLDRVARDWGLAREMGLRIHTHVGSDSPGGVISDLAGRGLLAEDVTLVHCLNLDATDLDAIASHGVSVSLTPSSEMAAGRGLPPVQELMDRGIRPGLGVDSGGIAPGDMFAQMRATNSVQHATHFELKLAGKGGLPNLLNTREVLRYATVDGARAAGLGNLTGALEPGKQADIIVLRTDRPNIFPINDPIGAVVWGMDTSNIDWVFVAGETLMRGGALSADVERARNLAINAQRRVAGATGLMAGTGGQP